MYIADQTFQSQPTQKLKSPLNSPKIWIWPPPDVLIILYYTLKMIHVNGKFSLWFVD